MIVDTSVLVALLRNEPEADDLLTVLVDARGARISAGSWIELGAVLSDDAAPIIEQLERVVEKLSISIAPVDVSQARIGQTAYRQYGKGRHPAKLNFGDCFAYALAEATGEPLLFKGDDFGQTDIEAAVQAS